MDFRCNQSRGLHFIYVIPFSKKKALIESTLFSKNVEDRKFYLGTDNDEKDHYWGFWSSKYSHDFDEICLKWNKWKIINYSNEKTFYSNQHPYCLINKKNG